MEINLINFIFFILMKKKDSKESTIKYFIIQSSGSILFLFSITINIKYYNQEFYIWAMLPPIALMLKSGMAPLHSWIPEIVKNFNYLSLLMILTMQKIIPIFILFSSWYNLLTWIAIFNIIKGSLMGLNQNSLIKLLIFSSINNNGWLIFSMLESIFMFMIFFTIYFVLNMMIIFYMKFFKIKWIIQMKSKTKFQKMYLFFSFLSLAGLPPFLGFTPKWMILFKMLNFNSLICFLLILFSLLTLYFYIKNLTPLLLNSKSNQNWYSFLLKFNMEMLFLVNFTGIFMWLFLT
uniref:NADH-ubiquinone oxidoreductase chain 2 n=1 Tax=Paurocephala sauteri TaxID=2768670 RepID=A0A7L9R566_9HEMI|nr:NADH dehydrogenase subunit 2 [Paurocephala sauteri]QOL10527.1 NADH dehydrogenase subunit 2 [Paurocephala sauteri]